MIEILPNWHPIFVHFTVSLFTVSTIFSFLAAITRRLKINQELLVVAKWTLYLTAIISVGTLIAGFYAYYTVAHDAPSHTAMTNHRNWALVTFITVLILAIWSWLRSRAQKSPGAVFLVGMLIGLGLLAATAWRGGELVYRHGLGVMSLPKTHEVGHHHDHTGLEHHDEESHSHDDSHNHE